MFFDKGRAQNLIFCEKRPDPELIAQISFRSQNLTPAIMKCQKVRIKLFCAISRLVIGNQELDMSKQQIFGAGRVGYGYKLE